MRASRIFVNPAGQRDNIGDSALRRAYLDALRTLGELHVYAAQDEKDYNSGLGLLANDVVYSSRMRWFTGALKSVVSSRIFFAANAGEVVGDRKEKLRSSWQLPLARLAKISGGDVLLAGVALRPGTRLALSHLSWLAKRSALVTWRDEASRVESGFGSVQPDWAFDLGGPIEAQVSRTSLAVALRGDRPPPSDGFVSSLRSYANENDLQLWVVVQVRRDGEAAVRFSERLGAEVLIWGPDVNHADHERAVREFYRTCSIVASDRIHALIIGSTEGAVPVGVNTSGEEKLRRTFAHITDLALVPSAGEASSISWHLAVKAAEGIHVGVRQAREVLKAVRADIAGLSR